MRLAMRCSVRDPDQGKPGTAPVGDREPDGQAVVRAADGECQHSGRYLAYPGQCGWEAERDTPDV